MGKRVRQVIGDYWASASVGSGLFFLGLATLPTGFAGCLISIPAWLAAGYIRHDRRRERAEVDLEGMAERFE